MKNIAIALTLLFATPIASAAPSDRVAAAAEIYAGALQDWEAADTRLTVSDLRAWSVQLLDAQLTLPVHKAAFADHLARMKVVEAQAQWSSDAGLIGSTLQLQEATFYRVEAERWLAHGRVS